MIEPGQVVGDIIHVTDLYTTFVRMRVQHIRMKDKWPDWMAARGMPYEDVENMRPETKEMVQNWLKIYGDAKDVVLGVESAGELI